MTIDPATSVVLWEVGKEFIKRIGGKFIDAAGDRILEGLGKFRRENAQATAQRAAEQVAAAGAEPHEIPPRVWVPLIEHASLEDDDALRERWAALLAHAAIADDPDEIPPAYVDILSQLTPLAAVVLETLEDTNPDNGHGDLHGFKQDIVLELRKRVGGKWTQAGDAAAWYPLVHEANALVDMLVRQGLATKSVLFQKKQPPTRGVVQYPEQLAPGGNQIRITELGKRFLVACRPLAARQPRPTPANPAE